MSSKNSLEKSLKFMCGGVNLRGNEGGKTRRETIK
jgi:hypothetical protein